MWFRRVFNACPIVVLFIPVLMWVTSQAKYVRYIVVRVAENTSLGVLCEFLPLRPLETDVVVACKTLGLTLKVLLMVRPIHMSAHPSF